MFLITNTDVLLQVIIMLLLLYIYSVFTVSKMIVLCNLFTTLYGTGRQAIADPKSVGKTRNTAACPTIPALPARGAMEHYSYIHEPRWNEYILPCYYFAVTSFHR